MENDCPHCGDSRAEVRREQILDAAADCFRAHGFHGASIARISKAAQMSAGHIYHYFDNKEAIIAAIVDRDLQDALQIARQFVGAEDPLEAMLETMDCAVEQHLDPKASALMLEIVAEASRNPKIAAMVQEANIKAVAGFSCVIRAVLEQRGIYREAEDVAYIVEFMGALFDGLTLRSVRNPLIDRQRMIDMLRKVMRFLIEADDAERRPAGSSDPARGA